jgi:hypothetical protein
MAPFFCLFSLRNRDLVETNILHRGPKQSRQLVSIVFEVLKFFGVASPEAWERVWESQVIQLSMRYFRGAGL